jgi:hypothetical protein
LRKPDPKAITDLLIFSLAADLDDRVRLVWRNTRWGRKRMRNLEYFVNKDWAGGNTTRVKESSPTVRWQFADLPRAAAAAAPLQA